MNEWFKKTFGTIKDKWSKWKPVQKLILIGIIVLIIVGIVLLVSVSSKKTSVRLFNAPVEDKNQRAIISRLEKDGVKADIDGEGYITVENEDVAKKYRSRPKVMNLQETILMHCSTLRNGLALHLTTR